MIRDGSRTLVARDRVPETWLREEVVSAYGALVDDPSAVMGVDFVFRREARQQLEEL